MSVRVTLVRNVRGFVLDVGFSDGSSGEIDFEPWLVGREGLFAALRDPDFFKQVRIDTEAGTLCWPNGVDLCPDVLRHRATGASLPTLGQPGSVHAA